MSEWMTVYINTIDTVRPILSVYVPVKNSSKP